MSTAFQRRGIATAAGAPSTWRRAVPMALSSLLLLASTATAQDRFTPRFSFDGFGTVGLTYSTEDQADFGNSGRPAGPGHSNTVNATLDSRLGGQATLGIGPKFTAVVQLIAEQSIDDDYVPTVEWANIGYSFTPDFSARAGRIVVPAFMFADSRKVSYSYPWVRPPVELYGMVPFSSLDGAEATYQKRTGEWTAILNLTVGGTQTGPYGGSTKVAKTWNVNTTLIRGELTGRVAVAGGRLSIGATNPLFDAFRAFGPEGEEIASRFHVDDRKFNVASVGVEYDPGNWFTMAELGWVDTNSLIGERLGGYVTAGYRWGAITSYATVSQVELLSNSSDPGLSVSSMPPEQAQIAAGLNARLNAVLASAPVQRNLAIGGRWDFMPGIALKAQVDFINVMENSPGTFFNLQPGFERGGSAQLVSVGTAFVF